MQHLGREAWFNLDTASTALAATKAREIYIFLRANGWDQTNARFKPETQVRIESPSLDEFLAEVRVKGGIRAKTLACYERKFRKIVADIRGLDDPRKFDKKKGGHAEWSARIGRVKLSDITSGKIQQWKLEFIAKAGGDPLLEKAARNSVNSFIRNSRCLFSPDILKHLSSVGTIQSPFTDIKLERAGSMKYRSEINPKLLGDAAQRDLAPTRPAEFLIFTLAIGAGLRRNEIDKMEWSWIDWVAEVIRIQPSRYFTPKTEESENEVKVTTALLNLIKPYMASSSSPFVVPGKAPRIATKYDHYRCDLHFTRLNEWLRSKGISAPNPLHSLRKEFGSLLCDQQGIWAASRALRHRSIKTTEDHYIDQKRRVALDLSSVFGGTQPQLLAVS